jgi:hypothetical protein
MIPIELKLYRELLVIRYWLIVYEEMRSNQYANNKIK